MTTGSYLALRLAIVEARVRAAVARRRAGDSDRDPDDRFRGLYISEAEVDQLLSTLPADRGRATAEPEPPDLESAEILARIEAHADEVERQGGELRLRRLARSFGLDRFDVELLLVALAPDLDPRFERLYGYLHDDVSRRRASAGLALELCGAVSAAGPDRSRLGPSGRLVDGGLLLVEEADRPFLTRTLRVPDRVASHLLGDDSPDPVVAPLLTTCVEIDVGDVDLLTRALGAGARLVYVREKVGTTGHSYAATGLARAGYPVVALDLHRLGPDDDPAVMAAVAGREARLGGGGLVAGPVDALADRGPATVRAFAEVACPVALVGSKTWDPSWSRQVPLLVDAPTPTLAERATIWRGALNGGPSDDFDPLSATQQFRLTPEQVHRAATAAHQQAAAAARPLALSDLHLGARAQNAAGLERLARRIEPRVERGDLVLPNHVFAQLSELTARARHRDRVLDEWGTRARSPARA